jgi:hypothetical protein
MSEAAIAIDLYAMKYGFKSFGKWIPSTELSVEVSRSLPALIIAQSSPTLSGNFSLTSVQGLMY